jgi:hypothetical protein
MARLLIVGGGCRGRRLTQDLLRRGHAARVVTRTEAGRGPIEAAGAECWIGDPNRLGTLRGALEGVTIVCWLMGTATGPSEQVSALHGPRLRAFAGHLVDTPVRGFVYEATGSLAPGATGTPAGGERIARAVARANSIPLAFVRAEPADLPEWLAQAHGAVDSLLGPPAAGAPDPDALS